MNTAPSAQVVNTTATAEHRTKYTAAIRCTRLVSGDVLSGSHDKVAADDGANVDADVDADADPIRAFPYAK